MVKTVYLLIGGNLGDARSEIRKATALLSAALGQIKGLSSIYRSEAWGYESENNFYNQLIVIKTQLTAQQILTVCKEIEHLLGRQKNTTPGYSDRLIDIDILYLDDIVIKSERLIIPHPRLHKRLFALLPLNEIIPEFIHPVLKKSNKSLLSLCPDTNFIEKLD